MVIKPLHAFMWAKEIPDVLQSLEKIESDKLLVKYTKHPKVMQIITKEFRERTEYTHLVIHCTDMEATNDDFQKIKKRAEEGYDVVAGICNVDSGKYKNHYVTCNKLPDLDYETRNYRWLPESQRLYHLEHGINMLPVKFAGYPLLFMTREVFERVNGLDTPPKKAIAGKNRAMWEQSGGYANDISFCHKCDELGIDIYVDLNVVMKHYRFEGELLAGKEGYEPKVVFKKYNPNLEYGIKSIPKSTI